MSLLAFVRFKRTSTMSASTQKVVNQLSALSASRKQPQLLRLCPEDLIKHNTITNAWRLFQQRAFSRRRDQLQKQRASIQAAMEDLKQVSPALYELANALEKKKRFPLEMRVPTDYPPTEPWSYNFAPKK